jgi:type IX secretion system PorP/SprF family membrane protein
MYSLNPASIDDSYLGSLSMGARKQWVNFDGAPATFAALGTVYFEDISTQLGMKIFNEKKGYSNSFDIDFSYTYAVSLQNYWKMNLGLSVSYQNFSYDISKVTFAAIEHPDIYDKLMPSNNINSDFGMELNNQNWKIGGSSHNLNSLFSLKNDLYLNTNIVYAMYKQNSNDQINYGFGVNAFQYGDIYQMEFNLSTFIKKDYNSAPVQIGAFYRTWHEVGLIFGFELDKFKVSYSCDYNFSRILNHSCGTHEILLTYKFNKSYRCRTCW